MISSNSTASYPSRIDRFDRAAAWGFRSGAIAAAGILLLVFYFLVREALPFLGTAGAGRLFGDPSWHPSAGNYNFLPMLLGTFAVSAGALLLAAP
ncbi:MAG: hypothetical protein L0Z55_09280, partial [Planctomycetes bacterium]|nr:hypothetical protein [Planctomycetota bacterium]